MCANVPTGLQHCRRLPTCQSCLRNSLCVCAPADILGAIMKAILGGKMLNTKHSSQMHNIFKTHQDQIDKAIK